MWAWSNSRCFSLRETESDKYFWSKIGKRIPHHFLIHRLAALQFFLGDFQLANCILRVPECSYETVGLERQCVVPALDWWHFSRRPSGAGFLSEVLK
jgi:hypothetical protein